MPRCRRICVNIGGTLEGADAEGRRANVWRFHRALDHSSTQIPLYVPGLGDELVTGPVRRAWNAATGTAMKDLVGSALTAIRSVWEPGDILYGTGFSRGAAGLRMLVDKTVREGVDGEGGRAEWVWVGLFDTVGGFGLPGWSWLDRRRVKAEVQSKLVYHLVAADEDRLGFELIPIAQGPGKDEIVRPGCHADVGGGGNWPEEEDGLADICLGLMSRQAARAGLSIDPLLTDWSAEECAPRAIAHRSKAPPLWPRVRRRL